MEKQRLFRMGSITMTMILQAVADYMPNVAYRKVYEICEKERLGSGGTIKVKGHVFVGDYTIDWVKGKGWSSKSFATPTIPKPASSPYHRV